jgi:hypothetical protein
LEDGSQDFVPVSPISECLVEVLNDGYVIALVGILAPEAKYIAKDDALQDTWRVGRLGWDVELQVHWLDKGSSSDRAIRLNCKSQVQEVDFPGWWIHFPFKSTVPHVGRQ